MKTVEDRSLAKTLRNSFRALSILTCAGISFTPTVLAQEGDSQGTSSPSASSGSEIGTTIVGESEAAIGLYLMPWSDEPMGDIDRPPRLLHEPLDLVDPVEFRRQVEWQRAQTAYRMQRLRQNSY